MKRYKKYILLIIVVTFIPFGYYIYSINNPKYQAPYSYTGNTVGYFHNDEQKGYKVEENDWDIKYIVEPLNQNNFASPRKFNEQDQIVILNPDEVKNSKSYSNDKPHQGSLYLFYKGKDPAIAQQMKDAKTHVQWSLDDKVGDRNITSGSYNNETGRLYDDAKEPIYDYFANDKITPNKKQATMPFELNIILSDNTELRYFGYISAGTKSIFNLEYLGEKYF